MAMICRNFTVTLARDLSQVRELWGFTMMPTGLALHFRPFRKNNDAGLYKYSGIPGIGHTRSVLQE
jgi:hypothetical protein